MHSEGLIKFNLHGDHVTKWKRRGRTTYLICRRCWRRKTGNNTGFGRFPSLSFCFLFAFSSGFLCSVLPSPPPPCLFLLFRPCLLVLTRSPVSLRRNRGTTVLLFWFVLLCCSLVLSVCYFLGFPLSTGFFFLFSPLVFVLVRPLSLVFCFCVLVSLFSFAYCVCVLKTKAKLGYAGFLFSSPVSVSFASPVVPSVLCFFFSLRSCLFFFRPCPGSWRFSGFYMARE